MPTTGQPEAVHDRVPRFITLKGAWEELNRVRSSIEKYFEGESEAFRTAATMTATELAENVLKHASDPGSGMVIMAERQGEVVISTQNRVESRQAAERVRDYVRGIASKGAREMYVSRMLEIMDHPDAHRSGMGLVRIAYEGKFELSCDVLGDRLHIQAKRRLDQARSN
jgi:hypothetical protein